MVNSDKILIRLIYQNEYLLPNKRMYLYVGKLRFVLSLKKCINR